MTFGAFKDDPAVFLGMYSAFSSCHYVLPSLMDTALVAATQMIESQTPRSRIRGSSAGDTEAGLRSWRLRFGDFFSRMWFLFWLRRLSLPEPVRLKRACAPLCVFILGIGFSVL